MKNRTLSLSKINALQLFLGICLLVGTVHPLQAQVFSSQQILYDNTQAHSGWYTENIYSPIDSYSGDIYFVMLDDSLRPFVGHIHNGSTDLQLLDKAYPSYKAYNDGHHEFSMGIDKDGYIHVTGDMHNFPQAQISPDLPNAYTSANILYWKSKNPGDISAFEFMGNTSATIPGEGWTYGHFNTDNNGVLYYMSRTLARTYYYQNGGRGLGLYRYNTSTQSWTALGTTAPISDASYPVIAWELSGQNGGSYQQYKGGIQFDVNNRMYITSGMNTQNGPAQVNSIIFAYSDDGGNTFLRADGSSISLPMQVASGARQADVIAVQPSATLEQPTVIPAFGNNPVVFYTESGSTYYKYWTGSSWSSALNAPVPTRGKLLFNKYTNQLLFVDIQTGGIYAKSSFTGSNTYYDAGETFRYFDMKTFRRENTLNGISWKTSTGNFEVIRLAGNTVTSNVVPQLASMETTTCYPNPFSDAVYISNVGTFTYQIADLSGKQLEEGSCEGGCHAGETLTAGTYVLTILSNGTNKALKVVKQ